MSTDSSAKSGGERKCIEPAIHFNVTRMHIGEGGLGDRVAVSELVRKGTLLLDFANVERLQERGFVKQPVQAGEHTYFSEDENALYARVPGYPRIDRVPAKKDGEMETLVVKVEPLFRVSPDAMKAVLAIHPPLPDGRALPRQNLDEVLAEAGIVYGIDEERIAGAKEYIAQQLMEFHTIPIASGRECGESRDAFLKFLIEIGPIAGKLLADGTIDFRERRVMVPVSEGDVLAVKIPARAGSAGINVYGDTIEAKPGKDLVVKTSGDVIFDQATNEVKATANGVMSVVRGSVISVSSRQKIESDIDFAIGNVESKNCLLIRGSVLPGFQVKADGDIEIGGTVSSASVEGHANVVIKGGITGQKTTIGADGDTDILFIEQGSIVCGGTCVVRKQAYYSTIHAGGDIRCRRDSVVVGGELVAAGSITLGDIGSEKAHPSLLAAGVVPARLAQQREMQNTLAAMQEEIIQQLQTGGGRSRRLRQLEREVEALKQKLARFNLIPGSGLYSRAGAGDDPQFTAEEYSDEYAIDLRTISIEVQGAIQEGTTIQIGNRDLVLDKTISSRLFRLSDNLKRILAVPSSRK